MIVCEQCGVELDQGIDICPLCDTPIQGVNPDFKILHYDVTGKGGDSDNRRKRMLKQVLWQVTSVLLLTGIVGTIIINLSIQKAVTWSVYPASLCLMLFSYATLMALWHTKFVFQVLAAWIISSAVLVGVDGFIHAQWPLRLALPVLSAINIVGLLLYWTLSKTRSKGLNILAIIFVAIAILCLIIEGLLSLYSRDTVILKWSVIVSACLLPVTAAILFMFFRTKNNPELQKIFHT